MQAGAQGLGFFFIASPPSAGSWIISRATETQSSVHMGCWRHHLLPFYPSLSLFLFHAHIHAFLNSSKDQVSPDQTSCTCFSLCLPHAFVTNQYHPPGLHISVIPSAPQEVFLAPRESQCHLIYCHYSLHFASAYSDAQNKTSFHAYLHS